MNNAVSTILVRAVKEKPLFKPLSYADDFTIWIIRPAAIAGGGGIAGPGCRFLESSVVKRGCSVP